tara:strand:+ start:311 stop:529 length:219 start_codon:yes stop_codon:yes gene_type:complete
MSQSTKLSVKELQQVLNDLPFEMEDRSVTDGDDFYRLYTKFFNVIEHTEYKVDIVDCLSALHRVMEDLEMYS